MGGESGSIGGWFLQITDMGSVNDDAGERKHNQANPIFGKQIHRSRINGSNLRLESIRRRANLTYGDYG